MIPTRTEITAALHQHTLPFLRRLTRLHAALGGLTEIRIFSTSGVWSTLIGPEDVAAHVEALVPVAEQPRPRIPRGDHPRSGEGSIHVSLNPIALADGMKRGPTPQRTRRAGRGADVVAVSWLFLDLDPVREPKGRSASDAERAAVVQVAQQLGAELARRGVPWVEASSGNGMHLLCPVHPAVGEAIRPREQLARQLLAALGARFSTPSVEVDQAVFDRGRVVKLYGTVAVKGEATAEHPHRIATIADRDFPAPVDLEALLGDLLPPRALAPSGPRGGGSKRGTAKARTVPSDLGRWREVALAALPLEAVYGPWLTGRGGSGWLECRDPQAASGDLHPSAGVADGSGEARRGTFHSHRRGVTLDVFEFLVERGTATDFWSAAAWVAEASGVPLPPRGASEGGQAAGREDSVSDVEHLPVRHGRRITEVTFVEGEDPPQVLHQRLLEVLGPTRRFFRRDSELVFIDGDAGPRALYADNFCGIAGDFVAFAYCKRKGNKLVRTRYDLLSSRQVQALVFSPSFRDGLPPLNGYLRSPVYDTEWKRVSTPGYHEPSGLYYAGEPVEPTRGTARLDELLQGFPFKSETDRVNLIGVLLTVLTMPRWTRGHPFLVIDGNKPGVGKSTLAALVSILTEGKEVGTVSYTDDDTEFEKRLGSQIEQGDRVVVIDNAKARGGLSSPVLERSVSDSRLSYRRLGSNTNIVRPQNDVLFILTANLTQLGPDLMRRALPVSLEAHRPVREMHSGVEPLRDRVYRVRAEVQGELLGMVDAWLKAICPKPVEPAQHSCSQQWAETIGAILEHAGLKGFLSNMGEAAETFDTDIQVMKEIAQAHHGTANLPPRRWAELLAPDLLADRLRDARGNLKSTRAQETAVGRFFSRFVGEVFDSPQGEVRLTHTKDPQTRAAQYGFERVA